MPLNGEMQVYEFVALSKVYILNVIRGGHRGPFVVSNIFLLSEPCPQVIWEILTVAQPGLSVLGFGFRVFWVRMPFTLSPKPF